MADLSLPVLILIGLVAVGIGFYFGLPGKYEQSQDDIEKAMDRGGARRNQVKRVFTPLDWLRKDKRGSDRRRQAATRRFKTAAPKRKR